VGRDGNRQRRISGYGGETVSRILDVSDAALLASREITEWAMEHGDRITRDEAYRIVYKHMNEMSLRYIELMKQIGD
jgi:hypothetical protein